MAMEILPGEPIRLIRRSPSFVFEVHHAQCATDSDIAGRHLCEIELKPRLVNFPAPLMRVDAQKGKYRKTLINSRDRTANKNPLRFSLLSLILC